MDELKTPRLDRIFLVVLPASESLFDCTFSSAVADLSVAWSILDVRFMRSDVFLVGVINFLSAASLAEGRL